MFYKGPNANTDKSPNKINSNIIIETTETKKEKKKRRHSR